MADIPATAWTGRHLLAWLQDHPELLDHPVQLMEMAEDENDPAARFLTRAEWDQCDEEGTAIISLCAWPECAMDLPVLGGPDQNGDGHG